MSDTGVVLFNYAAWIARYPELTSVAEDLATLYWGEASLYLDNSACSRVTNLTSRGIILNMITAHIAKLNATINGQAPPGLVGRISSATEGSVSVSTALTVPGSAEWFGQTSYGFAAWQAMAPYRRARYMPGPQPYLGAFPYGGRR